MGFAARPGRINFYENGDFTANFLEKLRYFETWIVLELRDGFVGCFRMEKGKG